MWLRTADTFISKMKWQLTLINVKCQATCNRKTKGCAHNYNIFCRVLLTAAHMTKNNATRGIFQQVLMDLFLCNRISLEFLKHLSGKFQAESPKVLLFCVFSILNKRAVQFLLNLYCT